MFVPRTNEQGAFWGLMIGLVIGMTRFILQIASGTPNCNEEDTRTPWLTEVRTGMQLKRKTLFRFIICTLAFCSLASQSL